MFVRDKMNDKPCP